MLSLASPIFHREEHAVRPMQVGMQTDAWPSYFFEMIIAILLALLQEIANERSLIDISYTASIETKGSGSAGIITCVLLLYGCYSIKNSVSALAISSSEAVCAGLKVASIDNTLKPVWRKAGGR